MNLANFEHDFAMSEYYDDGSAVLATFVEDVEAIITQFKQLVTVAVLNSLSEAEQRPLKYALSGALANAIQRVNKFKSIMILDEEVSVTPVDLGEYTRTLEDEVISCVYAGYRSSSGSWANEVFATDFTAAMRDTVLATPSPSTAYQIFYSETEDDYIVLKSTIDTTNTTNSTASDALKRQLVRDLLAYRIENQSYTVDVEIDLLDQYFPSWKILVDLVDTIRTALGV